MALSNMLRWATVSGVGAQQESTEFNRRVGANVRWFRKAAGVSQSELAQRLAERGFPFSQTTVVKTEQGARPLKFEEAVAISEILAINPADSLTEIHSVAQEVRAALLQLRNVEESIAARNREIAEKMHEIRQYEVLKHDAEDRLAAVGAWQDDTGAWHAEAEDGFHITTSGRPRVEAVLEHTEEASNG
jgi:transcriptional regulator with XRE-family HTH domain